MGRRKKKLAFDDISGTRSVTWSVSPETLGEIIGVLVFVAGVLFTLATLGLAGQLGQVLFDWLSAFFGLSSFLVPFAFIILGIGIFRQAKVEFRWLTIIGIGLCFLFVPGIFGIFDGGGWLGDSFADGVSKLVGPIAAFVLFGGLTMVSILVASNRNLKSLKQRYEEREAQQKTPPVKVNTGGVPIFTMGRFKSKPSLASAPIGPVSAPQKRLASSGESWQFPPIDLLELSSTRAVPGNINKNVETIQKTLADFNIDVTMADVNVGPTVTQYTLKPAEGVKITTITARANDLSLALAAHPIRVEAPIPGKSAVGIEVPNKQAAMVTLREVLESTEFQSAKSNLSLALGRDVSGSPIIVDLDKMPHLLIAGATGSGKSVCVNGIILSLLYSNSPTMLRIILVDPKRVEFTLYDGIPHLLAPVVHEVDKTINALRWAIAEMERRFQLFSNHHKRNLQEYNADPTHEEGPLPYIAIIIDELADLMAQASNEVEAAIVRLAQMARATGMHLVVATQRPSVDVITGLIKANIPTRVAFAVASQIDSRTIIDQAGADKLLGNGDMLYLGNEFGRPKRIQGVYMKEKEIRQVADYLREQSPAMYDESIVNYRPKGASVGDDMVIDDELFEEAKQVVIASGRASASLLQRRLRIGYARAARLLDMLEQEGVVGPADGAKPREVLVGSVTGPVESGQWQE